MSWETLPPSVLVLVIVMLIALVTVMGSVAIGLLKRSLHQWDGDLKSVATKLEELVTKLALFTPVSQHNSAYDKLHTRIDELMIKVAKLEERVGRRAKLKERVE